MGRGGGNLEYRAPLEAGAYRGSALWSRFGEGRGCGSGGHPRRGHQPPAAGSVVLRPLREQAARAWSHLHVPEQFVLMVTGTVADSRGLSLTVLVGVHQRQVAALAGANASGNALSSDAAITGTLTEVACQTPWPHAAAAALVLAGCGESAGGGQRKSISMYTCRVPGRFSRHHRCRLRRRCRFRRPGCDLHRRAGARGALRSR